MGTHFRSLLLLVGFLLLLGLRPIADASAQADRDPIYYVVNNTATIYMDEGLSQPYIQVRLRDPVYLMRSHRDWHYIRTFDGARGYVKKNQLSNVWMRVSKSQQMLYLYEGTQFVLKMPIDLGYNFYSDKEKRGSRETPDDYRTPEGSFFIARKNPNSKYYKALVINYPNAEDAVRGLSQGLITQSQYKAIISAEKESQMPPMNTKLGGWIEVHGHGTGAQTSWTNGCIAVRNSEMDVLWDLVEVGTPILIEL